MSGTGPSRETMSAKGEVRVAEPSTAARGVARRTAEARATIPDLELSLEVDMERALARRDAEGCSLAAVLMSACAAGLRQVPRANSAYRDARYETYSRINVGFVVAAGDTYLIPTLFDADRKSLTELSREIDTLQRGALEGTLAAPAYSGATFSLWHAGALGLDRAVAVINPPQAGALSAGAVREAAVVRNGELAVGRRMTLTLACDHRILYGARAAEFLGAVREALER